MKQLFLVLLLIFLIGATYGQAPAQKSDVQNLAHQIEQLEAKIDSDNDAFWIGILTSSVTLFTLLFGIYQYSSKKDEDFKKTIWEERKKLYMEVLGHSSRIAIAEDINAPETKVNRRGFWALYWGRLCVLEDKEVLKAMIQFGDVLEAVEQGELALKDSDLENLSYLLAAACRHSLIRTWQPVTFENLGSIARYSNKNEKIIDAEEEEN